jgi:GPI-GlcNAc transferase complex, PIG-H component
MTRPASIYDPSTIKDDDWILRITRVGEKAEGKGLHSQAPASDDSHAPVVEVTFTLSEESRRRQQARINAAFAGIALVVLLLPLPSLAALLSMLQSSSGTAPEVDGRGLSSTTLFASLRSSLLLLAKPWIVDSVLSLVGDFALKGLIVAFLWSLFRPRTVIQESVVALRGLGLQIKTLRSDGNEKCNFYDSYSLKSLLIHEGIQFCAVRYYAAVVVAGKKSLVLLFDHSRPRLPLLGKIYRALYPCLFPDAAAADVDRYCEPLLASLASGSDPQHGRQSAELRLRK